jgi:hypothetical protein
MREEIEKRLDSEVRRVFASNKHGNVKGEEEVVREKLIAALAADASWVQGYIYAGELDLKRVEVEENVRETMDIILERLKEGHQTEEGEEWHELIIPVDLPFMHVSISRSFLLHLFMWFIYRSYARFRSISFRMSNRYTLVNQSPFERRYRRRSIGVR